MFYCMNSAVRILGLLDVLIILRMMRFCWNYFDVFIQCSVLLLQICFFFRRFVKVTKYTVLCVWIMSC